MTDSLQGLHASPLLGSPLSATPAGSDGYGPSLQAAGEVLQVREWGGRAACTRPPCSMVSVSLEGRYEAPSCSIRSAGSR